MLRVNKPILKVPFPEKREAIFVVAESFSINKAKSIRLTPGIGIKLPIRINKIIAIVIKKRFIIMRVIDLFITNTGFFHCIMTLLFYSKFKFRFFETSFFVVN